MKAGFGTGESLGDFDEEVGDEDGLLFDEETVGEVADNAIGMSEMGDELGRAGLVEAREGGGFFVFGNDAVDAAMRGAFSFVLLHFRLAFLWEPIGVFDHVAIHVDDPKGAVGSGAGHDRTRPAIF